jgi:hypothetical protein
MLVGEIGIDRNTFFNNLRWWEVRAIIRGYNRRCKDLWSSTRWATFNLMNAQVGGEELSKHGINVPSDLLPLPWDIEQMPKATITDEDAINFQKELAALNKQKKAEE